MQKKYLLIFVLLLGLIVATGCTSQKTQNDNNNSGDKTQEQTQQDQNFQPGSDQQGKMNENFDEASSTDLAVGQTIMLIGSESNGVIMANQIMIGNNAEDFTNIGGPINNDTRPVDENQNPGDVRSETQPAPSDDQMVPPTDGETRERPDFDNMTDEEKAAIMERMGDRNSASKPIAKASMTRLIGEIISLDNTSITIKTDTGSKLAFYSESTKILKIKVQN